MGQLTSLAYPWNRVVTTSYEAARLLAGVVGSSAYAALTTTPAAGVYAYAENGAIQTMTLGNGVVESDGLRQGLNPSANDTVYTAVGNRSVDSVQKVVQSSSNAAGNGVSSGASQALTEQPQKKRDH